MIANRLSLSDGYTIPCIGFGNYNSYGEEEENAIRWALEAGYRYIDSATCYKNEAEIGNAWASSGVKREELYLLSKLWPTDYENAEKALLKTLKELRTDYLDAYLIHWPGTDEVLRHRAYEQVLALRDQGLIRTVGVSNFQPDQLQRVYEVFGEYPVINQMECHPAFQQRHISDYCKEHGIRVIDYRPINRGVYADGLKEIAEIHGKTIPQIVLRWHIQNDQIPIPKSGNRERIFENFDVFNFSLSESEMKTIDAMETGVRAGSDPFTYFG